jgi:hypothetical protein
MCFVCPMLPWSLWSWSYGGWMYNYLCNQCLSPLTWWVRIPQRRGALVTLCDKVSQWLVAGRWFSPGTPVSSTYKIDSHNITNWNKQCCQCLWIVNSLLFLWFSLTYILKHRAEWVNDCCLTLPWAYRLLYHGDEMMTALYWINRLSCYLTDTAVQE